MSQRSGRARHGWTILLALGLFGGGGIAGAQPATAPPMVETRAVPGRDVKQVNAQGIIDAPPHVVRAVVADLERYPEFMPYVKESRILGHDAPGQVVNYQRLSFGIPFVQDRHYVIRITERGYRDADRRRAWAVTWRLEDGLPPRASPDAIRV
ncbi:MAG TPA: SRPBCC family protein, partial [Methylomirabilota bacterium]